MSDSNGNRARQTAPAATGDQTSADGGDESGSPVDAESTGESAALRSELEAAKVEAAANYDRYLRSVADLDNLRKRAARDVENAHKFGIEKFARDILTVRDSLVKGIEAAGDDAAVRPFHEGSLMTLKMFDQVLEKFGITALDPTGEPFDPEWHEAMAMLESAEAEPNSILEVVQTGYQINGRLLRPAMVVVARAPAEA